MKPRLAIPALLALLVLLVLAFLASLAFGELRLSFQQVLGALTGGGGDDIARTVVRDFRLPRALVGLAVGAALGASGAVMQAFFRNPLASPGLLGVSSGGALGAVAVLALGPMLGTGLGFATASMWALPLASIIGAFGATGAVIMLARSGAGTERLLLSGVALNALLGAGTSFLLTTTVGHFEVNAQILFWLMGGLENRSWEHVWMGVPAILAACLLLLPLGRAMNLLSLGEQSAQCLGVDVRRLRRRLILLSTLLTALLHAGGRHLRAGLRPGHPDLPAGPAAGSGHVAHRRPLLPVAAAEAAMTPALQASGLTVLGRLEAVSLELGPGELVAMVGPNGAGKSTLIQALAGLLHAGGSVRWNGQLLSDIMMMERGRRLAWVSQETQFEFAFPVMEVVAQGRYAWGEDQAGVAEAMAELDLAQLAERPVTRLSGGERHRVGLARALATGAPLQLWDEPVAQLDVRHALEVLRLARRLADAGGTVLVSLHDLRAAYRFDRVLVLDRGRLVGNGRPHEVLTAPLIREVFRVEATFVESLVPELPEA